MVVISKYLDWQITNISTLCLLSWIYLFIVGKVILLYYIFIVYISLFLCSVFYFCVAHISSHWEWCQLWRFWIWYLRGNVLYWCDEICRSVWFGWEQRNQLKNLTDGFSTGENSTNFPVIYYHNSIGNWFLLIKIAHNGN